MTRSHRCATVAVALFALVLAGALPAGCTTAGGTGVGPSAGAGGTGAGGTGVGPSAGAGGTGAGGTGAGGTGRGGSRPAFTGPDPLAGATHPAPPGPPGAVLTQRGDDRRLGWNAQETRLTVASVAGGGFGKVAALPVDGKIYAQPLYVPGLVVGGAPYDVVIVATEHDSLYAFDAHATGADPPLWHTSLLAPGARPMLAGTDRVANNQLCDSIVPEVGITGTPVIDWTTRTLYAVALDVESGRLTYRIHAVDIGTGRPRRASTVISATVDGRGLDSSGGTVSFTPARAQQRMGLALVDGVVYAGFASFCGWGVYHGWILGYRAADLSRAVVYNSSPDAYGGGFWESQSGITVDGHGHLVVVSGNGPFTLDSGGAEAGDSVLTLSPQDGTLRVVDFFTPFDQDCRNRHDQDLGSGSPLPVPGHDEYLLSSKTGSVYLLDAGRLGGYTPLADACTHKERTDVDRIKQELTVDSVKGGMWGTWGYWRSPDAEFVYSGGADDRLTQWRLDPDGRLVPSPVAQAPSAFAYPGAIPVVSSNGSAAGTGIVWTIDQTAGTATGGTTTGGTATGGAATGGTTTAGTATLRAFDAADIGHQLWSSAAAPGRDALDSTGGSNHFQVPTIAGGRVFVGGQNHLEIYGLPG
jgi:hypothetical protein